MSGKFQQGSGKETHRHFSEESDILNIFNDI